MGSAQAKILKKLVILRNKGNKKISYTNENGKLCLQYFQSIGGVLFDMAVGADKHQVVIEWAEGVEGLVRERGMAK